MRLAASLPDFAEVEPVHPPQEPLNAFNARILPVQIAIRRRREQLYKRAASAP